MKPATAVFSGNEAASGRALEIGARPYSSVNSIPKTNRDRQRHAPLTDEPAIIHEKAPKSVDCGRNGEKQGGDKQQKEAVWYRLGMQVC